MAAEWRQALSDAYLEPHPAMESRLLMALSPAPVAETCHSPTAAHENALLVRIIPLGSVGVQGCGEVVMCSIQHSSLSPRLPHSRFGTLHVITQDAAVT